MPCTHDAEPRDYMYFIFMVLVTLSGHLFILAMEVIKGKRVKAQNLAYVILFQMVVIIKIFYSQYNCLYLYFGMYLCWDHNTIVI